MKPATLEWVQKAEGDWTTANRELRARNKPNFDAAAFHAQQCAEKYLKARLQEAGVPVHRTHDLVKVADSLTPVPLELAALRAQLDLLNRYAVEVRYPGTVVPDRRVARVLVNVAGTVRKLVRRELGLPPDRRPRQAIRRKRK